MPSNYAIFDHWKFVKLDGIFVVKELDFPRCWACDRVISFKLLECVSAKDYRRVWNNTSGRLERCHIVPKEFGGENTPDNTFLLCKDCHAKAPDTESRDIFLSWVVIQRKTHIAGYNLLEIKNYCQHFGIDYNEFWAFVASVHPKELEVQVTSHDGLVSTASFVLSYMKCFMEEKSLDLRVHLSSEELAN